MHTTRFSRVYRAARPVLLLSVTFVVLCSCAKQGAEKREQPVGRVSPALKAYQATYSSPQNFLYHKSHFYSDGKGHVRMDIEGEGVTPATVNILDLNTNETTAWAVGANEFARRPSQPTDPLVMQMSMSKLPTTNAQALGEKTIDGHKCHGWKSETFGNEVWVDDDYGCPVLATSSNLTTTLVNFSAQAPDTSLFQPPAGHVDVSRPQSVQRSHRGAANRRTMNGVQRLMRP
jgi:hypothetical protein